MKIFDLDLNNMEAAKAMMTEALETSEQKLIRVYITKPREVSRTEKADKKAAAAQAKEDKVTAKLEKTEAKAAKKAEKEAAKTVKELSKKTTESVQPTNIEKAAEKAINAPAKKSHHNKTKGY